MSCATSLKKRQPRSEVGWRLKRHALGAFRLLLIAGALFSLFLGNRETISAPPEVLFAEAKGILPEAESMGDPEDGFHPLLAKDGELLGWATSTWPQAEKIQGYSGPSELFVLLSPAREVLATTFLRSADTSGHVAEVKSDQTFWKQWNGFSETRLGAHEKARIVSGATLTSDAMARGVAARFGAHGLDEFFPKAITTADVAKWFPTADRIQWDGGRAQVYAGGNFLGTVLRSSRMGVLTRGFNGPSDVLIALSTDEKTILGVGLAASRDNQPYVGYVKEELLYADEFAGLSVTELIDPEDPPMIVSGASVTLYAVIVSVKEMLELHLKKKTLPEIPWKSALAVCWIALGVFAGVSKRAAAKRWRLTFAAVSVIAGLTLGWMLSQDQLIGWGRHGLSGNFAVPLLVLTAVALLVPAFTGKNVYCSRICPHGAAQSLLGAAVKKRFALPRRAHDAFQKVPWLTLGAIWITAMIGLHLPYAQAEPFEIWSSGFYALVPAAILSIGLVAAVFLPQAYCHYGCPTGALLKFLTHSPSSWTRRDTVATLLVSVALVWVNL